MLLCRQTFPMLQRVCTRKQRQTRPVGAAGPFGGAAGCREGRRPGTDGAGPRDAQRAGWHVLWKTSTAGLIVSGLRVGASRPAARLRVHWPGRCPPARNLRRGRGRGPRPGLWGLPGHLWGQHGGPPRPSREPTFESGPGDAV